MIKEAGVGQLKKLEDKAFLPSLFSYNSFHWLPQAAAQKHFYEKHILKFANLLMNEWIEAQV